MPSRKDATDLLCEEWAHTRRELLGLANPRFASEYLGAVRSVLGSVKDYADGSSGPIRQHFPEVYPEKVQVVNRAFHALPPALKDVMDLHYGCRTPTHRKWQILGIGRRAYFERVGRAKTFVEGYIAAAPDTENSAHHFREQSAHAPGLMRDRKRHTAGTPS